MFLPQIPNILPSSDPLDFWKSMCQTFPNLSKLARTYLAPPPSSTASEREFKVAKNIQSESRARLLPANLEKLLFLKYNLRALGYRTNLSTPPEHFILPNSKFYDERKEREETYEDDNTDDDE